MTQPPTGPLVASVNDCSPDEVPTAQANATDPHEGDVVDRLTVPNGGVVVDGGGVVVVVVTGVSSSVVVTSGVRSATPS